MKKKQSLTMGEHVDHLNQKMEKIKRHETGKKIWRIIALFFTIATCAFSVIYGMNTKTAHLEEKYQKYSLEPDRMILDALLLEYKDTLLIFEQNSLGNRIAQTQMGGFFYDDGKISIYPDVEAGNTKIKVEGRIDLLSHGFASNINVYDNYVYFRDTSSMELKQYDLSTRIASTVDLYDVDQFVICDGVIVFKDSESGALMWFQDDTDPELISAGPVVSFTIAGNQIIYLQEDHSLHAVNLSTKIDEVVTNNVNSFFFDGKLWIQNNTDIYVRTLSDNTLNPLVCSEECRRILGTTSNYLIFDGSNAICVYNMMSQYYIPLSDELVFVGASFDDKLLVYNMEMGDYQIIQL